MNVNFKANYISSHQIKKLDNNNVYNDCAVNFVKLNSQADVDALFYASKRWKTGFLTSMYNDAKYKLSSDGFYCFNNDASDFYALTSQQDYFEHLDPYKILGVAEITDCFYADAYHLDYLQTNPKYKFSSTGKKLRPYKNIGEVIINKLKEIYSDRVIMLMSSSSAEAFYKKNGFKSFEKFSDLMFWSKTMK